MNNLIRQAKKIYTDSLKIRVRGGNGGPGFPQYGGIGGKGGDVCIKASKKVTSLEAVKRKTPDGMYVAKDGESSRRTRLLGRPGHDLIINVPVGVTVEDINKQILGDLDEDSDQVIVAMGGRGGDKFNDNHGFRGQARTIKLDFKMISDVVFVGFPNAGKSSLLRAVSNATPRVANYPFTTLRPHLGTVKYKDFRTITMADLPGLVEGAHDNLGLGHDFLKHVIRSRILAFLVDINNVDLGPSYPNRSPLETLCILNKEIELYDDTILKKPSILLISKMDTLEDSGSRFSQFEADLQEFRNNSNSSKLDDAIRPRQLIQFEDIIPISTETNLNIERFKNSARQVIDKYAEISKLERDKFSSYEEMRHLETNRLIQ